MRTALLVFPLAVIGCAQTRVGQCGATPILAEAMPSSPVNGFAPKPENSRTPARPVLPQIQYRRPPALPFISCWCGSVSADSLTSESAFQELPMVNGLSGNFRFDHVWIQEASRFSSDLVPGLVVSAGRPNAGEDFISQFALKSEMAPRNFAYEIPEPPVLTGTYNLVLKFLGTSPLAIAGTSNFTSGVVNWEVCGHQVPRVNQR